MLKCYLLGNLSLVFDYKASLSIRFIVDNFSFAIEDYVNILLFELSVNQLESLDKTAVFI